MAEPICLIYLPISLAYPTRRNRAWGMWGCNRNSKQHLPMGNHIVTTSVLVVKAILKGTILQLWLEKKAMVLEERTTVNIECVSLKASSNIKVIASPWRLATTVLTIGIDRRSFLKKTNSRKMSTPTTYHQHRTKRSHYSTSGKRGEGDGCKHKEYILTKCHQAIFTHANERTN